jgi:K+/H+ antiporter YhaU regulatory subunit KhtT
MNLWHMLNESEQHTLEYPPQLEELSRISEQINLLRTEIKDNFTALGGEVYIVHTAQKHNRKRMDALIKKHVLKLEQLRDELEEKEKQFGDLRFKYENERSDVRPKIDSFYQDMYAADADVEQITLQENSPVLNQEICALQLPKNVHIGAIFRGKKILIPHSDETLKINDKVVLFGQKDALIDTISIFLPE